MEPGRIDPWIEDVCLEQVDAGDEPDCPERPTQAVIVSDDQLSQGEPFDQHVDELLGGQNRECSCERDDDHVARRAARGPVG